jgi:LCP family protein required for cell wall assembly
MLAGFAGLTLRRADQALSLIQQEDPRRRAPTGIPSPTALPVVTPLPAQAPAVDPRPTDPPAAPTAEPTLPPDPALPEALQKPVTILLLGVDRRPDPNDGVRSDTMILVQLNAHDTWASMLSIPRDTMTQIPHLGIAKINAAYGYGYTNAEALYGAGTQPDAAGGALVAEALEGLLDVRVDYIAQIDFSGFERLVDSIGGVVVDVPTPLLDPQYPTEFYSVERVYIPAGLQVMNGRTALTYARSRHSTSDFDRSRRQQQVLRAVLDQARARDSRKRRFDSALVGSVGAERSHDIAASRSGAGECPGGLCAPPGAGPHYNVQHQS